MKRQPADKAPGRGASKTGTRRAATTRTIRTSSNSSSAARAVKPAQATSPVRRRAKPAAPARITATSKPLPRSGADALHWTEALRDGTHVLIRPIRKQDAVLEKAFIERLSPQSRRMRFLGQISEPSAQMLRDLTQIDFRRDMAFVALVHRGNETREIGVSRFSTSADGRSCECAVTVSDEWHHQGLATLLMRHLIEVARARGIRTMLSYDSIGNIEMRELAAHLGFHRRPAADDRSLVVHTLAL